jgi:DNA-binding NarL/FixJ family response regulator
VNEPRRVKLEGEDPLTLAGLARLLDDEGRTWIVAASFDERPDVVLVDLGTAGSSDDLSALARRYPVLALAVDAARAREALSAGARGVVSRNATGSRLTRALDAVLEGLVVLDEDFAEEALRPPPGALGTFEELTPRETEVLEFLALGLSNREIAERLGVSFHTVKFHVNSILGKLGAGSRTQVVALAARAGLLRF